MEPLGRASVMRAVVHGMRLLAFIAAIAITGCAKPAAQPSGALYITQYGLGPDKWATAWLLTHRAQPGARLLITSERESFASGILFDHPAAEIRRVGNRSAFEVARERIALHDPILDDLTEIITDIEVNYWSANSPAEARLVEDAFRGLQYRYGRDTVTPHCYIAFFERVYQVLSDAAARGIPASADRLELDCEDLTKLANRQHDLVPEVPIIDVLSAAAAGRRVVFVDVRESDEYEEGHIPGALNIPLRDVGPGIKERLGEADYVVSYCVKDFRGFEMAKALAQAGVENSVIMRPYGIKGWVALGLPISGSKGLSEVDAHEAFGRCLQNARDCIEENAGS